MCTSQLVFSICMQPEKDTSIPQKDDNISENFGRHEDDKSTLEEQNIKGDYRIMVGKSSHMRSRVKNGLLECTPLNGLLASESSAFLREIKFSEQEFFTDKLLSDIKYFYPGSQKDNPFYLFND